VRRIVRETMLAAAALRAGLMRRPTLLPLPTTATRPSAKIFARISK
jgi:hypothetical protein